MKIETYKCEICKTVFSQTEAVKEKRVKAIYFKDQTFFEVRELPQGCDTHICFMCLEQLTSKSCI